MALKVVSKDKLATKTFWREVVAYLPNEAGTQTKAEFDVHYRPLPRSQEKAATEALKRDDDYEAEWFKDHVIGFKRVEDDETGEVLSFEDAFERVFEYTPLRTAVIGTYHKAMAGQKGNG